MNVQNRWRWRWGWMMGGLLALVAVGLVGCGGVDGPSPSAETPSSSPTPLPDDPAVPLNLPDLGRAPEIENDTWLNSAEPITLASVRGKKAVLVEFWTFGCINCKRTIPWIRQWHDTYAGDAFVVISVHYPEFSYERDIANVQQALIDLDVPYAVAIDNERLTWGAYNQRYWPTTYLIDKEGVIRFKHIGEFNERSAAEAEQVIEQLIES